MRVLAWVMSFVCSLATAAIAQSSASYRNSEHVLNLAGHPADSTDLSSASFHLTLDSLGEAAVRASLASSSYHLDSAFAAAYPPPSEVHGVRFADRTTLAWDPERSAGSYNAYRDSLSALPGGGYGACWQPDLPDTQVNDPASPAPGSGFFYLVTVENRLREEGTKGTAASGAPRDGSACP
ncbi:MAG: hypothetical protein D6718_02235 [Acidobacteria bacterium]|nr:MAG: hypothetical protein D6718_02235 [Acidobacteriota bacterium]